MQKVSISIATDFNVESVAEEIMHQLTAEGYDIRPIAISTNDTTIFIESNTVLFTQQFLNVLFDTTDGYKFLFA